MFRQFIGIITTIFSAVLVTVIVIMLNNGEVNKDKIVDAWFILWIVTSFVINIIIGCILNFFDGRFDL
jgi:phosphatidylglycerophosphate synthase